MSDVVYLWGLADDSPDAAAVGCAPALHCVQALLAASADSLPRLFFVTRAAQPVDGFEQTTGLQQAPLWGLGRVVSQEHPELACRLIDLDPVSRPGEAVQLASELQRACEERQVGLRKARTYVPRLVPAPRTPSGDGSLADLEHFRLVLTETGTLDQSGLQASRSGGPGGLTRCASVSVRWV